ncbi:MAG: prepilin peptidase [Phycisphaerae bacterium]|nr:prepilin peptidase [Phycisphaerae bacterium]
MILVLAGALGACVGSFVNVVIYRLPRGLSVSKPRRSFCPRCERSIAGYDNIPVLSYLLLRGRCRHCKEPISIQYPIVELVAAMLFVATYDVLVVARWREGIGAWPHDAAIVIAFWTLWAGLLATAVMDLELYYLDIRVTWFVAAVGVLCHAFWTPDSSAGWVRPGPALAAATLAAVAALVLTFVYARRRQADLEKNSQHDPAPDEMPVLPVAKAIPPVVRITLALGFLAIAGYVAWVAVAPGSERTAVVGLPIAAGRLAVVVAVLMLATIAAGSVPRAADETLFEAIETERFSARRMAMGEAGWLIPATVAGLAAMLCCAYSSGAFELAAKTLHWNPIGPWRPLLGVATGLSGWLLAGALGWAVRLIFTLALGKEAFGVGDIHILAAAGAVLGWPAVVLGFFISAPLALVGIAVFTLRRRSRAIQYGPWLAIGFFVAAAMQDWIVVALREAYGF